MAKIIGVDLGTANTFVYLKGKGICLKKPTVVTIDQNTREVVAIGHEAKQMLGKTPEGLQAFRPLKNGVIADFDVTAKMMRAFFEQCDCISLFSRPTVIVSIPHGVTEVEMRAVEDVMFAAGARSVALIDEPLAAAIGLKINVNSARGNMIVDIGGGTTEVAVISLGGIVESRSTRSAGDAMNEAIVQYLKSQKGLIAGILSAEQAKHHTGVAHPSIEKEPSLIFGRDVRTGHAMTAKITSDDIRRALSGELKHIVHAIRTTLENTPPELSSDIYDRGIILTGGGACLPGIDLHIREQIGIPVTIAQKPFFSVCHGIGRIIESEKTLGNLLRYRGK